MSKGTPSKKKSGRTHEPERMNEEPELTPDIEENRFDNTNSDCDEQYEGEGDDYMNVNNVEQFNVDQFDKALDRMAIRSPESGMRTDMKLRSTKSGMRKSSQRA